MFEQNKLLEADIKALVLNKLINNKTITSSTTIVSEFNVNKFSRRVDLALINDNCFTAIEIKSDSDNLSRLISQTETYQEYFDKVIVVAASKHIEQILNSVPQTVAVWEVYESKIVIKQRGRKSLVKDKQKYIELMNANELSKLANQLKIKMKERNRANLEPALIDTPLRIIRPHTLTCISQRFHSSSLRLQRIVKLGKSIQTKDIELLSKYKQRRMLDLLRSSNNKRAWIEFSEKTEDDFLLASSKN